MNSLPSLFQSFLHPNHREEQVKESDDNTDIDNECEEQSPWHHPERYHALKWDIPVSIVIDEEEFGLVFAESQFGGILPVPFECLLYGAIIIVNDLAIFFLVLIPQEPIIPLCGERSTGIREYTSFLMVHFEYSFFFFIFSPNENIASRGDMDIAGIAELHGEGDGQEFIPGTVYLEGGDGDFSLRIGDFCFEEGEDGGTASEGGFSFGYLFTRTGKDESIVVSESGGGRDIE